MNNSKFKRGLFSLVIYFGFLSAACEKYLNEPSNKNLAVISTLDDTQALLDNVTTLNNLTANTQEVCADDYYLTDEGWESMSFEEDRRMYIWAQDNVFRAGGNSNDWRLAYRAIYFANIVLENLDTIERNDHNETRWDDIKGQAFVFRAISFLDVAQIWALAYDATTAQSDVGIPLRLQSDFNIPSTRASLQQTYDQIISDLKEAVPLLPVTPVAKTRPSKTAAYGLLARTYLWMRDYPNAKLYADSCLALANDLMDYNQLNTAANFPIQRMNIEIIFDRVAPVGQPLAQNRAKIPFGLYMSYAEHDIRKNAFFRQESDGQVAFKGFYFGGASIHKGLATDEMYLTRAECLSRDGKLAESLHDLNTLLETRWRQGEFIPITASSADEALLLILEERRKQLLFRGLRWMDIKRLNREGANISLTRTLKGETYRLPANSPRFALPLPNDLLLYFR